MPRWNCFSFRPQLTTTNKHTFKRGEASAKDQLQITELTLSQHQCREGLGLLLKLSFAGRIANKEVLEHTTVGFRKVGHFAVESFSRRNWGNRIEGNAQKELQCDAVDDEMR